MPSLFSRSKKPISSPNSPPPKPCPELAELFTKFVGDNLFKLIFTNEFDEYKKGVILQFFIGAFPELTSLDDKLRQKYIVEYNKFNLLDEKIRYNIQKSTHMGGSKKRKQIHKKKFKKLN